MDADAPIMLVEDEPVDAMTVMRALRRIQRKNPLQISATGREALDRLRDAGGSQRPSLILLDLNLPLMSGHEFMERTKSHPELKTIPVVVVTTSDHRDDVRRSYELGAAGYIVKRPEFSSFVEALEKVLDYWTLSLTVP